MITYLTLDTVPTQSLDITVNTYRPFITYHTLNMLLLMGAQGVYFIHTSVTS